MEFISIIEDFINIILSICSAAHSVSFHMDAIKDVPTHQILKYISSKYTLKSPYAMFRALKILLAIYLTLWSGLVLCLSGCTNLIAV